MEIDQNSYILGYWFAADNNDNCWYMIVKKGKEKWEGQYTFRYNKEETWEDDPFSGKDEKNIYSFSAPLSESEDDVIEKINELFKVVKIKYNSVSDFFLIQGNAEKFMDIAKTKSYLHIKQAH